MGTLTSTLRNTVQVLPAISLGWEKALSWKNPGSQWLPGLPGSQNHPELRARGWEQDVPVVGETGHMNFRSLPGLID